MPRGGRLPRSPERFGRDLLEVAAGVLVVEVASARRGGLRPRGGGCEPSLGGAEAICCERWGDVQGMWMTHPSQMLSISCGGGRAVEVRRRPGLEVQVLGPLVAAAGTSCRM